MTVKSYWKNLKNCNLKNIFVTVNQIFFFFLLVLPSFSSFSHFCDKITTNVWFAFDKMTERIGRTSTWVHHTRFAGFTWRKIAATCWTVMGIEDWKWRGRWIRHVTPRAFFLSFHLKSFLTPDGQTYTQSD